MLVIPSWYIAIRRLTEWASQAICIALCTRYRSICLVRTSIPVYTYLSVYSFKRNHRCPDNQRSGSHSIETGETLDSIIASGVVIVISRSIASIKPHRSIFIPNVQNQWHWSQTSTGLYSIPPFERVTSLYALSKLYLYWEKVWFKLNIPLFNWVF